MGYTHYWRRDSGRYSDDEWRTMLAVFTGILAESRTRGISIVGWEGEPGTAPEISKERIMFNGSDDLSHETFDLTRDASGFNFCKTARKPYDATVVATLLAAERYLPGFSWSSDGESEEGYKDEGQSILDAIDPQEEEVA